LESADGHESGESPACHTLAKHQNHGNSFLLELDRAATGETRLDCMGGFVVTLLYGLPRATADLDVLLIAPGEQREPLLELGVRGGAFHRKYRIYLDYVGVAKVPED
jgi:hypothetical protein